MNYVVMDYDKGIIQFPSDFFNEYKQEILDLISHFVMVDETDSHLLIQTPKKLEPKKDVEVYTKKEKKMTTTCTFCTERVVCMTSDYRHCKGFNSLSSYHVNLEQFQFFLREKNYRILFSRM